ncbi:hypothetical protein Scep_018940 [Stephania cephalantha]|uniref:Uncharacterized protein n=1 Tax=Stephania cephalantha TaxID=152367 RepID=A0AAP0IAV9_9MAGN
MPIATSRDKEEIEAEIRVFFHWIDCLFCLRSSQRAMAEVESAKALTLAVLLQISSLNPCFFQFDVLLIRSIDLSVQLFVWIFLNCCL